MPVLYAIHLALDVLAQRQSCARTINDLEERLGRRVGRKGLRIDERGHKQKCGKQPSSHFGSHFSLRSANMQISIRCAAASRRLFNLPVAREDFGTALSL